MQFMLRSGPAGDGRSLMTAFQAGELLAASDAIVQAP
jgi:hypothetical protein